MSNWISSIAGLSLVLMCLTASPAKATFILYDQNFENPTGFVNDGGDINIFRTVNQLYGNQPPGFTFAQNFTVETLLITGNRAFGTGYSDPQGIGGNYALGMLSTLQNDFLSLSFNVQGQAFLNFRLNISSIDLDRFSGPFNSTGAVPVFELTLFDNPSGATGLSGNGTILDVERITGVASSSRTVFNWTEHTLALDARGSTNGNVTIRIDLLNTQGSGYAAMDNFRIAASNTPGDVGDTNPVPAPASITLLGIGLAVMLVARRNTRGPRDSRVAAWL
jgi:hypothetical protein